ncbi:hypothetical protein GOV06_05430 [Candidatus Woesearchaeota archaeon]|nr:hypothetical protein [Candidatus Woesearchaeota archaeon]
MYKKGQAAMEFLMTYGWAILVVLAAIAALAYFGVLSPDRFLPEKCTMPSGIACIDFRYSGTAIEMAIQNGAGFDMTGISVAVNGTGCNAADNSTQTTLTNGQQATYSVTCSPASGKFKGDVTFAYTNQATSMAHTKVGEIIIKIP